MPNVLLFSSSFDGHRQVHAFVYTHILKKLGFTITIAGDFKKRMINSFYIDKLKEDSSISIINTASVWKADDENSITAFLEIQEKCKADLTLFAEADNHIRLFTAQIMRRKRLKGKIVGLFFRPLYFYRKLNLLNKIRYFKRLPSRWRSDEALFHEFCLEKYKLLDTALYLDEKFVSYHKYGKLLPDVFQSYANRFLENEFSDQRIWIDRLNSFKERNKGKFIFLYFGTMQKRRGYDMLLKMAVENNACFVHCGLFYPDELSGSTTIRLRQILQSRQCLLETNEYIIDPTTIESFFRSTDHLILPYQNSLGSSGVMLQALEYGIPCLMPDTGVPGYLIKKYNLGLTYNYTTELLEDQFKKFIKIPKSDFKESINEYMKSQTPEELEKILTEVFAQSVSSSMEAK
jgi:glycosyltransferase involved in cell wall biosynthesis